MPMSYKRRNVKNSDDAGIGKTYVAHLCSKMVLFDILKALDSAGSNEFC